MPLEIVFFVLSIYARIGLCAVSAKDGRASKTGREGGMLDR